MPLSSPAMISNYPSVLGLLWLMLCCFPFAWSVITTLPRSYKGHTLSVPDSSLPHTQPSSSAQPVTRGPLRKDYLPGVTERVRARQLSRSDKRPYITSVVPVGEDSSPTHDGTAAASGIPTHSRSFVTHTTKVVYQPRPTSSDVPATQSAAEDPPSMGSQDVFQPIESGGPPKNIPVRNDHPLKKEHLINDNHPTPSNKFFANMFLGTQTMPVFTHPYSLVYNKGNGTLKSYGIAISHIDKQMITFGPVERNLPGAPAKFYINPMGILSFILSAKEFDSSIKLQVDDPTAFSANAVLSKGGNNMTVPMVQGMGFVTAKYSGNLTPLLSTTVFFRDMKPAQGAPSGMSKYRVTVENNTTWLIYVAPESGSNGTLNISNNYTITGSPNFKGVIQVAKNPAGQAGEAIFDQSAGVYATGLDLKGSVDSGSKTGTYSFNWKKEGPAAKSASLLMYALPHHVESFAESMESALTKIKLQTTTKGEATACVADSWTMNESELPIDLGLAPWIPGKGSSELSKTAKDMIKKVAPKELSQDMPSQTDVNSMYFSGKGLAKFAFMIYTVQELVGDKAAASKALDELKKCFATFVDNKQEIPLVYDNVWKGIVSSGTYQTGDPNMDFGNTYYNDHHFHYGYFVLTAAILGHLDKSWLTDKNKAYVNALLRDAGNSVGNDPYYPFSRGFDWYHGHSWAKGLFESADSKDQESTSEDTMFAYGVKMWGKTVGDASTEARGNLMLAVLKRSLRNYFLMESDNKVQPRPFIDNKVTGILFENKADHTTYFGTNLEYIQGIHMLPLFPASPYVRSKNFVNEEWNAMFAENATAPASKVQGGWKGVLYANDAIRDAKESWNFFAQDKFDDGWLDNGASRTWSLAFAAGLGGA